MFNLQDTAGNFCGGPGIVPWRNMPIDVDRVSEE
jgi:hypothetical protein